MVVVQISRVEFSPHTRLPPARMCQVIVHKKSHQSRQSTAISGEQSYSYDTLVTRLRIAHQPYAILTHRSIFHSTFSIGQIPHANLCLQSLHIRRVRSRTRHYNSDSNETNLVLVQFSPGFEGVAIQLRWHSYSISFVVESFLHIHPSTTGWFSGTMGTLLYITL